MAKLVNVHISLEFWQQMMTVGWSVPGNGVVRIECIEGLPEGAEIVDSDYDYAIRLVVLTFTHDSFADVSPGKAIPEITPTFQEFYED